MTPLRLLSRKLPIAQFIANSQDKKNDHAWWHLSPKGVEELARILGFTETQTAFFKSKAIASRRHA